MLKVVKIGGNIVDNPEKLDKFLSDFAALEGPKILIHGGGKIATSVAKSLDIESVMIDGRRVTDKPMLDVVTMVYGGLINKRIVAKLQSLGCNAFGLTGADGGIMPAARRKPVTKAATEDSPETTIDYGFVGDPVDAKFGIDTAATLIDAGFTIVAAPLTIDAENFTLLNTNADTVARTLAVGMSARYDVELVYCFEKRGVLLDVDDDNSVVEEITPSSFQVLKSSGAVYAGMLPKIENAFDAINCGVNRVVICSAEAISSAGYAGTTIRGCAKCK